MRLWGVCFCWFVAGKCEKVKGEYVGGSTRERERESAKRRRWRWFLANCSPYPVCLRWILLCFAKKEKNRMFECFRGWVIYLVLSSFTPWAFNLDFDDLSTDKTGGLECWICVIVDDTFIGIGGDGLLEALCVCFSCLWGEEGWVVVLYVTVAI